MTNIYSTAILAKDDRGAKIVGAEDCSRFVLRLPSQLAAKSGPVAGFQLDLPINTCATADARTIARLGPDEWLLLGPKSEAESVAKSVRRQLNDRHFSLVDIGHHDVAFAISGHYADVVLNGGCPLDLSEAAFPSGSATRTLFGKAQVIIMRPASGLEYRLECRRSFAPYVLALFRQIWHEYAVRYSSH